MYVYSDTVYLGSDDLRSAVRKRWEIHAWKVDLGEKDSADVWIKVTRPVFTFDWRFVMTDRVSGQELGAGRIVAWDGKRAADAIAADIARAIARVRAVPMHLMAALGAEEANSRKWQLTYFDGSEGPRKGVKLSVSVSPERIVGRREGRVVFVIPARSVSGVGYNVSGTDPSKGWDAFWTTVLGGIASSDDPSGLLTALALAPVAFGGELLLHQFSRTEHLCDIAWVDAGSFRNIVVNAGEGKIAQQFLAAVEEVSNRKGIDMAAEAATLRQTIEREDREGNFITVRLDKRAAVGWKLLALGEYRMIVVERQPGPALAYFLTPSATGTPIVDRIAAQIPVTIEQRASVVFQPQALYRDNNGITTLNEIVLPDRTFGFSAIPLEFASEPQISEVMEQLLADAAIRPPYRSVHVKSDTVYLKRELMERSLAQHPAFVEWEMKLAQPQEQADLELVVTRPFLTFDWTYAVTVVQSGKTLIKGKITARDGGRAATLIADELVNALRANAAQERTKKME